MIEPVVN